MQFSKPLLSRIASVSVLTSVQQSIMNFGILMIQSLVNSFGIATMAAFAAGVKIDSFAYSPAQDFANGFATFVAQNTGAGKLDRVRQGIREAALLSLGFCAIVSALVFVFARPLLTIFIDPGESAILDIGVHYLRVEGVFYVGIGMLFLLYAIYLWSGAGGHVRRADGDFAGLARGALLCLCAAVRRNCHLAVHPHRLVHRRYRRHRKAEIRAEKSSVTHSSAGAIKPHIEKAVRFA